MFNRKSILPLALATALASPLAFAHISPDRQYVFLGDESGWQIRQMEYRFENGRLVHVDDPAGHMLAAAPEDAKAPAFGDISPDRQYVFLGEESGWQLRPMEYRFENSRLVHVDDPVGHMHRKGDNAPLTAQERATRQNSAGG